MSVFISKDRLTQAQVDHLNSEIALNGRSECTGEDGQNYAIFPITDDLYEVQTLSTEGAQA